MPVISFVIITMNRQDDLALCLKSLQRLTYPGIEILVVDNGSSDGTVAMMARDFSQVKLIQAGRNLGVAGGRNRGIKEARGSFIAFLDDDATLENKAAGELMLDYFERFPEVGVLSFCMLDAHTGKIAPKTIPRRDKQVPDQDTLCGHFLGGGCVFRTSMLKETGVFWEKLNPFGSEEFDLSYRILESGFGMLWVKDLTMIHYESPASRPSGRRVYFETRNRPWVALRSLPFPYVLSTAVLWWGYMFLKAVKTGQLASFFRGFVDCLRGVPSVLRVRKKVTKETISKLKQLSGPLYY